MMKPSRPICDCLRNRKYQPVSQSEITDIRILPKPLDEVNHGQVKLNDSQSLPSRAARERHVSSLL